MVNCLKKITFFYLICFLGITAIFCLYYKKNKIEVKMSSYNEEIVFFDYDGKIEGMYLEANKPIEDVFLYYTIKQNALPQDGVPQLPHTSASSSIGLPQFPQNLDICHYPLLINFIFEFR